MSVVDSFAFSQLIIYIKPAVDNANLEIKTYFKIHDALKKMQGRVEKLQRK